MKEHNKENLTNLADFLGTTLKYGDKVVFCDPHESRKCLEHGTVVGLLIREFMLFIVIEIVKS